MAKRRKRSGGNTRKSGSPSRSARSANRDEPAASKQAATPPTATRVLDNVLLALTGAGVLLTAYLTVTNLFGEHAAFCGADSDCDLVQSSRWSIFLGVPMSLWGMLTYLVLARLVWRLRSRASTWRTAVLVAFVGVGVSWFLTVVALVEIDATCVYCLTSFGIINAILVLLLVRRPAHMPEHAWRRALPAPAGVAVAVVLGLHLHFSGLFDPAAGPEDPYLKNLAIHLEASGARFYGAYWCPHCQEQKALFASSASRLPYVECTPEGRGGPVSVACLDNEIRDYPTWIIAGRKHPGILHPDRLARETSFRSR